MIISANSAPNKPEFDNLLNSTVTELNCRADKSPEKISSLLGRSLEPFIRDVMTELAVGTPFEGSIELISGQKFPDIIAKKYYGIEVKTTTQNHWKTTGNSVLETTRVESVERIFMLFAKMAKPIQFRCRPYEDVLSDVVVTHSPRYLIDMNLEQGKTIFDKIRLPYDILRKKNNPIRPIIDYYKGQLKEGEELWWIEQENNEKATNFIIKIWNSLSIREKNDFKIRAMAYFPEIFGNSGDKFGRLALWLVTSESVVCPNVRDLFTAGGKATISFNGKIHENIPRIFLNLFENLPEIYETIISTPAINLSVFWKINTTDKTKFRDWINLIDYEAKNVRDIAHLDIKQILNDAIYE